MFGKEEFSKSNAGSANPTFTQRYRGSPDNTDISRKISTLPKPFIENSGQLAEPVAYYSQMPAGDVFVTHQGEIVYAFSSAAAAQQDVGRSHTQGPAKRLELRETFIGGHPSVVRGQTPSPT